MTKLPTEKPRMTRMTRIAKEMNPWTLRNPRSILLPKGWRTPQRGGVWLLAGWLLLAGLGARAVAQVSLLDTSFKVGKGADEQVTALVVQADQRILVGGEFNVINGCTNAYLARLEADGTVDAAFNPTGQTDGNVQCLLQQPDSKVLVGGAFGQLLGQPRRALARLLADGTVDGTFDASSAFGTNDCVYSLARQDDGRLLVGCTDTETFQSRIVRVLTNGAPDSAFVCTNDIHGYVMTMLPQSDGTVLFGGSISSMDGSPPGGLYRLMPDGKRDTAFDPGLESSSVFCLVRQPDGKILVGGLLRRTTSSTSAPLLRLSETLEWDNSFTTDAFDSTHFAITPWINTLLRQPDGKLILGGYFFEVGGYWRRHIVRLTSEGHVDGCFDPGLGLGSISGPMSPVRAAALQADGRIVIGGYFFGVDTAYGQRHLGRLLPQSNCDQVRVYLQGGDGAFTAATFPPGGTNYLDSSDDLTNWHPVAGGLTDPYAYNSYLQMDSTPRAFFRARQER